MALEDRRAEARIPWKRYTSVLLGMDDRTIPIETRDVSSKGIFFFTDAEMRAGATIALALTMPAEITGREGTAMLCRGRIVRSEFDRQTARNGVAVHFHESQVLPVL